MTYEQSAKEEKLTPKQKAKRIAFISSYIAVFFIGGLAVPRVITGWNLLIAPFFESEKVAFVAPKTEEEIEKEKFKNAVTAYFKSESHQARCMAQAEEKVAYDFSQFKLNEAKSYKSVADKAGATVENLETRIVIGVSDATATQTIALETKAGRR